MEKKVVLELTEHFRKGMLNRRDFIQKLVLSTGSVVAAGHTLAKMGFEESLVREVKAGGGDIETADVSFQSGNETVPAYLAKPAGQGPFPTMIVIHEIFGLSNFAKDVARLFARRGYLALAPCFTEGNCVLPDGKHAEWMMKTIQTGVALVPLDEQDKLRAAFNWLAKRPDVDATHIASVGFCWGGARSFTLATLNENLWAAIVFYGSTPPLDTLDNIQCPVLGLYSSTGNDINPTGITGRAAETAREMRARDKTFEWEVYNNSAHGFFRDGTPPEDHVSEQRPALLAKDLIFDFLDRHYDRG